MLAARGIECEAVGGQRKKDGREGRKEDKGKNSDDDDILFCKLSFEFKIWNGCIMIMNNNSKEEYETDSSMVSQKSEMYAEMHVCMTRSALDASFYPF